MGGCCAGIVLAVGVIVWIAVTLIRGGAGRGRPRYLALRGRHCGPGSDVRPDVRLHVGVHRSCLVRPARGRARRIGAGGRVPCSPGCLPPGQRVRARHWDHRSSVVLLVSPPDVKSAPRRGWPGRALRHDDAAQRPTCSKPWAHGPLAQRKPLTPPESARRRLPPPDTPRPPPLRAHRLRTPTNTKASRAGDSGRGRGSYEDRPGRPVPRVAAARLADALLQDAVRREVRSLRFRGELADRERLPSRPPSTGRGLFAPVPVEGGRVGGDDESRARTDAARELESRVDALRSMARPVFEVASHWGPEELLRRARELRSAAQAVSGCADRAASLGIDDWAARLVVNRALDRADSLEACAFRSGPPAE